MYFTRDSLWFRYFVCHNLVLTHPYSNIIQMLYLFFAETANLLIEIGVIYEPLIIRYGP
jgi:hypothetical protein